jgi:diguanylate cyclase (GGDEF)-like protein/PAS domain S-box-containing protein
MVAVGANGMIRLANAAAAQVFGWPVEDLVGLPIERLVPPDSREHHAEDRARFVEDGGVRPMGQGRELPAVRRDGSVFIAEVGLTTIEVPDGPLVIATVVDVSERREERDALAAANERLEEELRELEARRQEERALLRLTEHLFGCRTADQVFRLLLRASHDLFNDGAGAVYRSGRDGSVRSVGRWGDEASTLDRFGFSDCIALTDGRTRVTRTAQRAEYRCPHASDTMGYAVVCIPMLDGDQVLGLLHLVCAPTAPGAPHLWLADRVRLAQVIAARGADTLSSIRSRDRLLDDVVRDPLTGLYNRRYLDEALEREVARARDNGDPVSVVLGDVDGFKHVNDRLGHLAGDRLLRVIAGCLRRTVRASDVACRFGGDEFVILFPGASLEDSAVRAEGLRAIVSREAGLLRRGLGGVTMTFGVAAFPRDGATGEDLLRAADEALYRAKRAGGDRVVAAGVDDGRSASA